MESIRFRRILIMTDELDGECAESAIFNAQEIGRLAVACPPIGFDEQKVPTHTTVSSNRLWDANALRFIYAPNSAIRVNAQPSPHDETTYLLRHLLPLQEYPFFRLPDNTHDRPVKSTGSVTTADQTRPLFRVSRITMLLGR
jgi:hypothetical protein